MSMGRAAAWQGRNWNRGDTAGLIRRCFPLPRRRHQRSTRARGPALTPLPPPNTLSQVLGAFMLTQLRRLMICEWRLPFPSGTASGLMLTSFHTAVRPGAGRAPLPSPARFAAACPARRPYRAKPRLGRLSGCCCLSARAASERRPPPLLHTPSQTSTCLIPFPQAGAAAAIRKVKVLSYTGAASFAFSMAKWFVSGADYACGLGAWPTFGFAAMKYTFNFDFQLNYIGAGGGNGLGRPWGNTRGTAWCNTRGSPLLGHEVMALLQSITCPPATLACAGSLPA